MSKSDAASVAGAQLPVTLAALDLLKIELRGAVVHVRLDRPAKRNAVSDALVAQLHTCFVNLPDAARAVVLSGEGDHFCAGLDLAEVSERSVAEGIVHSRSWHAAFERVQFGKVPVVVVLHGAVVGGGGSARIPRLIGTARMTDMMLTGRVYDAHEGHAIGISHYLVQPGEGLAKALALAERIAANAPLSNFAVMHALPRIADMAQDEGLFVESLMAAIASGDEAAKLRVRAFLEGRAAKVKKT